MIILASNQRENFNFRNWESYLSISKITSCIEHFYDASPNLAEK